MNKPSTMQHQATATVPRAHLWTEDKGESPTAKDSTRRVSSASAALREVKQELKREQQEREIRRKREREADVVDLTKEQTPCGRQQADVDSKREERTRPSQRAQTSPPTQAPSHQQRQAYQRYEPRPATRPATRPARVGTRPTSDAGAPAPGSVGSAWLNAAMAWRQRNMPSPSELRRRKADAAQRAAKESAARKSRAKEFRFRASQGIHMERERQRMDFDAGHQKFEADPSIVRPVDTASAEDWQAYFRAYHGSRIRNAASFVQVLRAFGIQCDDPKKIKLAYMQAVRMYHPDSNSKSKTFRTARDRLEAEEIMKLINQRKPEQFTTASR